MAEGVSTRAVAEGLEVGGELVGREAERAALTRAVAAAVESSGGLVLLAGEAGGGKTTPARDALPGGVLLPELGAPPERGDRATLFEAVRCALTTIAGRRPTAILLDDLQWADDGTLELLPVLAGAIA